MTTEYFFILEIREENVNAVEKVAVQHLRVEITPELYDYLLQKVARLTVNSGGTVIADEI